MYPVDNRSAELARGWHADNYEQGTRNIVNRGWTSTVRPRRPRSIGFMRRNILSKLFFRFETDQISIPRPPRNPERERERLKIAKAAKR